MHVLQSIPLNSSPRLQRNYLSQRTFRADDNVGLLNDGHLKVTCPIEL